MIDCGEKMMLLEDDRVREAIEKKERKRERRRKRQRHKPRSDSSFLPKVV